MKKVMYLACWLMALASCSKSTDYYKGGDSVTDEDIKANVENVFGTTFAPNHDWCTTKSGKVTITAGADVEKVQVVACVSEVNDEGETVTSLKVLNEAETGGEKEITLHYDAPEDIAGLYVAFISPTNYALRKVEGGKASYAMASRKTRSVSYDYTLPDGPFTIGTIEDSWASKRGWITGEKLYGLSDYSTQKMSIADYTDEEKQMMRTIVFSYFKNGRKYNNLPLVKQSGYYNDKVYPITTGSDPILISPVFKWDSGSTYGDEVMNSDLYYYYFKEEDLGSDPVAYLESLPKYKAIPFNEVFFDDNDDNVIRHTSAYALLYWGDGVPTEETEGSYIFPKGYKIGFMVRAKTIWEAPKKQGEVYGDGRLNHHINKFGNFATSHLGETDPRAAWLTVNGRMLLCWESGTDSDFNDIILDIEGGVEPFVVVPEAEQNVYTFCFEDTQLGDYDLNDVVIKASRKNATTVEYSIVACGAYDELYVRNINSGKITDDAEVHELFGKSPKQFINTTSAATVPPVTVTKTVPKTFSFLDAATQPYIYDKTSGITVKLSVIGQDPHAIMIPNDFKYPLENTCIKDAYLEFNNWGMNSVSFTDWYTKPVSGKVYE